MRITVYQNIPRYFLGLLLFFLVGTMMFSSSGFSQDEPELLIDVYDSSDPNESVGAIIFEGRSYDITVYTEDEPVILGVNITYLDTTYQTSLSEPYITVEAPLFDESDFVVITATKDGFQPATIELTVLKGELSIVTDRVIVEEKKEFRVTVTDQDNNPVQDALVYVTEDATPLLTDQQGSVVIQAPETEMVTTATLYVIKSGYLSGSTTIRIENVQATLFNIPESQFFQMLPVLLAVLVVIFSVLYVLIRKRSTAKEPLRSVHRTESEQPLSSHTAQRQQFKTESTRYPKVVTRDFSASNPESRVEEIRIPVQTKKKETTIITEQKEDVQISEDETKHPDEWFKGQEYMRYKIDELTGKIDQKTDGKWFEGEQDTKYKVDETLKKNLKKKKIDEDPYR
jgi:hypothetical protein